MPTVTLENISFFCIFFFSMMICELAKGYTALFFGDTTAEKLGKLTANPLKHIDFFGSIIMPIISTLFFPITIGSSARIPIRYEKFKKPILESKAIIALVGILAHTLISLFAYLIILFSRNTSFVLFNLQIMNAYLVIFFLLPFPGLPTYTIVRFLLKEYVNITIKDEESFPFWQKIFFSVLSLLVLMQLFPILI
jgi:Zn-dependent protease